MATRLKRLLIVDDDVLLSTMLVTALDGQGYRVLAASDSAMAVALAEDFQPDLAVIDLDLGMGPSGLDLATRLRRLNKDLKFLIITVYRYAALVDGKAPVPPDFGYVVKDEITSVEVLAKAIEQTLAGYPYRSSFTASDCMITRSQAEVLRLLAFGYSNEVIAAKRGTSLRSVEHSIQRIYQRLGLRDQDMVNARVEAVRMYRAGDIRVGT